MCPKTDVDLVDKPTTTTLQTGWPLEDNLANVDQSV